MQKKELVIIGGGLSATVAAIAAFDAGVRDILILERRSTLPSALSEYREALSDRGIEYAVNTDAQTLSPSKLITARTEHGILRIEARAVLLATGSVTDATGTLLPHSPLLDSAHILLDPRTKSAIVDQNRQTEIDGIFVCGDALHIHSSREDLIAEAADVGVAIAGYLFGTLRFDTGLRVEICAPLAYAVPQCLSATESFTLYLRSEKAFDAQREILLLDGENIVLRQTFPSLSPDCEYTISLPESLLQKVSSDTLILSIETNPTV